MNTELTDKNFWDTNWDKALLKGVMREYAPYKFCRFHHLIKKYLPPAEHNQRLLEVGCVPGRHLVYFRKEFGFQVDGVDFSDHIQLVHDVMRFHEISEYNLHKEDFLNFHHEPYNVVASFGFLEHFTNWQQMLKKHLQMTAPGGYIIVSVPNLKYFQYTLHKFLDPDFENEQVVDATDLNSLKECIVGSGFTLLYAGYYQTFHFFAHHREDSRSWWRQLIINGLIAFGSFCTRLKINVPTRWFSPQVICIARNDKTTKD